jgi:hypothetical protein
MAGTSAELMTHVLTACRSAAVAAAAGVATATWASTSAPYVFPRGTIGLPHRRRLPCVAVSIVGQTYDGSEVQAGESNTIVELECHAQGTEPEARAAAQLILAACAAAIHGDAYAAVGSDQIAEGRNGPRWHVATMAVSVAHTYGADWETT